LATAKSLVERNVKLVRPALIIVENASDVFGGNGNDPIAVKRFVTRHLGGLCAISGATLALIQHPSVSGMNDGTGRAGTVQWRNAGRWFLNFVSVNRNNTSKRAPEVLTRGGCTAISS
jgi:RecA-family ATPase